MFRTDKTSGTQGRRTARREAIPGLFPGSGTLLLSALVALFAATGAFAQRQPPAARPLAVVLDQPDLPKLGAPSDPYNVAAILRAAGWDCRLVSAVELADAPCLAATAPGLVVLPYGPVFPAEARDALLAHLQRGGGLITTGGYAFNHLVRWVDGRWVGEEERLAQLRRAATATQRSLLSNGSLEALTALPVGGYSLDGRFRVSGTRCQLTDAAHEGRRALLCAVPAQGTDAGANGWADLPAVPGRSYEVSAWVKTEAVTGGGIAFVAMYQYDDAGALVEFRDFAAVRGTTPWTRYVHVFTPRSNVARLHLSFGLYQARGNAWIDDLRLCDVTGLAFRPMNTATGNPQDGLETLPLTLGMFDADYPLKRVAAARTARGQYVVPDGLEVAGPLSGWAASGTVGEGDRWVPLLEGRDRYGRSRGAVAALLIHHAGPFAGSCWAYFGADNVDLLADPHGPGARALAGIARFLARGSSLTSLTTDRRLYRDGEPVRATATVARRGPAPWRGEVEVALASEGASGPPIPSVRRPVVAEGGARVAVPVEFPPLPAGSGLWTLTARLSEGSTPIDERSTGVVRENPGAVAAAPPLRFRDSNFTLGGRPLFLFGSDDYAVIYQASCENPLTWGRTLSAARDIGVQLYENLQYSHPDEQMTEADWRSFGAMSQLVQERGMVFMPGVLIGHNVAIGDNALARESRLCAEYAQRFRQAPALLWYLNGDYVLDPARNPADVRVLWNRWLRATYPDPARWSAAWGDAARSLNWGDLAYPPRNSGRWDDPAAVDRARFDEWMMLRWNDAHVAAVRRHDPDHAITSEYYRIPIGSIDLVRTIGAQDVSNIGYFGLPEEDIRELTAQVGFNDLRLRGKGVGLGEYGVKTHPAWSVASGGLDYHIMRTPEEQRRLFMAVAHYGLGLGACKVQNWCLRDDPTHVFPWGLFYPGELVPKDVAYVHRNQSLVWRFFAPAFRPAAVAVCLANQLRRGNGDSLGPAVAHHAFGDLLALHLPFNTIDDDHLEVLPPQTRLLLLPSPLTMNDAAYASLLAWVRRGGVALVTGDLSRDEHRRPTRAARLAELAGLERVAERYPDDDRAQGVPVAVDLGPLGLGRHPLRPCLKVRRLDGDVLGAEADGAPVLVRRAVGKGLVYFLSDPIEQSLAGDDVALRRRLDAAVIADATCRTGRPIAPLAIEPDDPRIHLLRQPTAQGAVLVVANNRPVGGTTDVTIRPGAEPLTLHAADGWPALVHAADDGRILALSAAGAASVGNTPLMTGRGLRAVLSLDRLDLRRSEALVVAPFEPGELDLPGREGPWSTVVGDFRDGKWVVFETRRGDGTPKVTLDADRATCLVLLCRPGQEEHWGRLLEEAMTRPERLPAE